eukprot:5035955-Alexandrium_andersonii.AAC.1
MEAPKEVLRLRGPALMRGWFRPLHGSEAPAGSPDPLVKVTCVAPSPPWELAISSHIAGQTAFSGARTLK